VRDAGTGRYQLARGRDTRKDQSYVLYTLDNAHLARTLMPIGELPKEQVRALARELGLPVAEKPESQEICFVHAGAYHEYVGRARPEAMQPGPMVDEGGALVGTHRGIGAYTVGQRKGLGITASEPTYVSHIDPTRNLLVVGPERLLYSQEVTASDLHLTSVDRIEAGRAVQARVRSRAEPAAATVLACASDTVRVCFERPQRAVTPGQALVLYDGDIVLGGGTIVSAA
jgi:tRNA-specific 2-thiouridylase